MAASLTWPVRASRYASIDRAVKQTVETLEGRVLLAMSYTTSWIGNTFSGSGGVNYQDNTAALWVAPNGTAYTNCVWDESGREGGIYNAAGQPIGRLKDFHGEGGQDITSDGTYIYAAAYNNVLRFDMNGNEQWWGSTASPIGAGEVELRVRGLAVSSTELFVSDTADNQVKVFDKSTRAFKRSWTLDRPRKMALAPDGYLWIIQKGNGSSPAKILRYSIDGVKQPQEITGPAGWDPQVVIIYNGKMYVGDNGPDQNIKIYNGYAASRSSPDSTFGETGGIFAGPASTRGSYGQRRFNGISGLGFDSSGNLYVAQNGGTIEEFNRWTSIDSRLEKYDTAGNRVWIDQSLEFLDAIDADASSENSNLLTVYSKHNKYQLDLSKTTPGSEWTVQAHTMDRFRYASDPRWAKSHVVIGLPTGAFIRNVGGRKLMFVGDQNGEQLRVYRFNQTTDGEIAIPAGLFSSSSASWFSIPNQPGGEYIWRDSDADGYPDAGEFFNKPNGYNIPSEFTQWYVDANGDIWQSFSYNNDETDVRRYRLQGFDANGVPNYGTYNDVTHWQGPSATANLRQIAYDSATDTMYLVDRTGEGDVLYRYNSWKTGRSLAWSTNIRLWGKDSGTIAIAGDFVFVGYPFFSPYGLTGNEGMLQVYRKSDGGIAGQIKPGPEVGGQSATLDISDSIRAFKRSNGEYLVFAEENLYGKQIMYRWTPPSQAPAAATLSVQGGNTMNLLTWSAGDTRTSGFRVQRATSSAGPWTTLTDVQSDTRYLDTNNGAGLNANTTYYYRIVSYGPRGDTTSATISATTSSTAAIKIDSQGQGSGDFWPDAYSREGSYEFINAPVITAGVANAAPEVVYQTLRNNNPWYIVPKLTPGGTYTVRLHMQENWWNDATRKFNVDINGVRKLTDYSPWTGAGGVKGKAAVETFTNITANAQGEISIDFNPGSGGDTNGTLGGFEIIPAGATPTIPAAPTGLSATANSQTQITINWADNSNNESGFRIERKQGSGGTWTFVTDAAANATSYVNTGLTAGTQYYYRVLSWNGVGASAWSNEANATTQPATTVAPIGRAIGFKAYNNLFVSSDHSNTTTEYLRAGWASDPNGSWEKFDLVDLGGGYVGIRSQISGKLASVTASDSYRLRASSANLPGTDAEKFTWESLGGYTFALKSKLTGKYVTADLTGGGNAILRADWASGIDNWERFTYQDLGVSILPTTGSGTISYERWNSVSGTSISNIPLTNTPSATGTYTSFEIPSNAADNYGMRLRGYLTAPATGAYTFWIAGDDNAELWLGTNDQASSRARIAYHTGWTNSREWNKYATQKSAPITLVGGARYYIEALMKEGGGGDNLSVGWLKPGQTGTTPSQVIPGTQLSPFSTGTTTTAAKATSPTASTSTAFYSGTSTLLGTQSPSVL